MQFTNNLNRKSNCITSLFIIMAYLTSYQLEQRTELISLETYEELINSGDFTKIQETPKNILTTYSIRFDKELGGVFIWSGGMQRYYLIAKRTN